MAEDSPEDETLILRHLSRVGYDVQHERVETPSSLRDALRRNWDIILSDFAIGPHFTAPDALEIAREAGSDTPFIVLSGTIGEEAAVQAMKGGANDYVLKGNLARLQTAIERELRDAAARQERRRMREQLVVSDRLASIGMLAASVAHEINNPLTALVANLEFLSDRLDGFAGDDDGELADGVRDAMSATNHLRRIVGDLGVLSRPSTAPRPEAATVDIENVLETATRMAWHEVRLRARLTKEFAGVPPVEGDESRLAQVFLNLLVNAAQAIEPGASEENEIRVSTSMDRAGRVVVGVSDTGSGMAPDVRDRIFDAFYTTKPSGVGTGLGLAICHRIVTSLGGAIDVQSAVGAGTTFRVLLWPTRPLEAAG
jgi:signal transduction histidine kinase